MQLRFYLHLFGFPELELELEDVLAGCHALNLGQVSQGGPPHFLAYL